MARAFFGVLFSLCVLASASASADWVSVSETQLVNQAGESVFRHEWTTAVDSSARDVSSCSSGVDYRFDPSLADSSTDATLEIALCKNSTDTWQKCRRTPSASSDGVSWSAVNGIVPGENFLIAHASSAAVGGDVARVDIRCKGGASFDELHAEYLFDDFPAMGDPPVIIGTDCLTSACNAGGGTTRVVLYWDGVSYEPVDSAGSVTGLTNPLVANLDADGYDITNPGSIGSRIFYASTEAEIRAAEIACEEGVNLAGQTGCIIQLEGGVITLTETIQLGDNDGAAPPVVSTYGNAGLTIRGAGMGSALGSQDGGTVLSWAGGSTSMMTLGAGIFQVENIQFDGNDTATAGIEAVDTNSFPTNIRANELAFFDIAGPAILGPTGDVQMDTSQFSNIIVSNSSKCAQIRDSQSVNILFGPNFQCTQMNGTGPFMDIDEGSVHIFDSYFGSVTDGSTMIDLAPSVNHARIVNNQFEMPDKTSNYAIKADTVTNGEAGRIVIDGNQFVINSTGNTAVSIEKRGEVVFTNNVLVDTGTTDNGATATVSITRDDGAATNRLHAVVYGNIFQDSLSSTNNAPKQWYATIGTGVQADLTLVAASSLPATSEQDCITGQLGIDTDDGSLYPCVAGEFEAFSGGAPAVNTSSVASPLNASTEDWTSWFAIDGKKEPTWADDPNDPHVMGIAKTKVYGEERYMVNLTETEAYGEHSTVIGGGDTDLIGINLDIFGTGGSQASGDEGYQGVRIYLKDNWITASGTLGETIAAGAGTSEIDLLDASMDEEKSKMLGEGKLIVFGSGTAYSLTTGAPGTQDYNGTFVAGWSSVGGAGSGVWVLGSSPGIASTGYCLSSTIANYSDINTVSSRVWLEIVNVSGTNVTTRWLNQGYDAGVPYGMLAEPGASKVRIAPCAKLGPPVFDAGDKVADRLTITRDAGFPGASGAFTVSAYPGITQTGVNIIMANSLGRMYESVGTKALNLIDGSAWSGRYQQGSGFSVEYSGDIAYLEDAAKFAWARGLYCLPGSCETGFRYDFDANYLYSQFGMLNLDDSNPNGTYKVLRIAETNEDSLAYDADAGGWGEGITTFNPFAETTSASKTTNNCAKWDSSGRVVDAGAACGTGTGNVSNSGTPLVNQLAYWTDATTVVGDSGLTYNATSNTLTADSFDTAANATDGGEMILKEGADDGTNTFKLKVPNSGLSGTATCTLNADGTLPATCLAGAPLAGITGAGTGVLTAAATAVDTAGGFQTYGQDADSNRKHNLVFSDFVSAPVGDGTVPDEPPFWTLGLSTGTVDLLATPESNHPGVLACSSSGSANSGCSIHNQFITAMYAQGGEVFEIIFQHKIASGTNTTIRMGFTDKASGTVDEADGAYIEFAGNLSPNCKTAKASTRSTSASPIATLTVDTWYRARVTINSDATSVTCQIWDASGTSQGSQSLSTNIPTGTGNGFGFGVKATQSTGTTAALVWIDYMAMWHTRELVR